MRFGQWFAAAALIGPPSLAGCSHEPWHSADLASIRARDDRLIKSLLAQPTPEHLATAALLAVPFGGEPRIGLPLEMIERAELLAPQRPELLWEHLALCRRLQCDAKLRIEDRLKAVDPQNGFVWASDLERAQASGSEADVTDAISRIGSGSRMTLYWNELEVMLVDGLAAADPSESLADRGVEAIGLLAMQALPPLQPMSKACRLADFDIPGRRTACQAMFQRMEQSSTVLTQGFALAVQERWWPAGTPQREALRAKRRRLDYLMMMSSRHRWGRVNRDMAVRIDAARRTEREEDVELALLRSFGLPTDPPEDWKDTLLPG
jgi:hypothetical protein